MGIVTQLPFMGKAPADVRQELAALRAELARLRGELVVSEHLRVEMHVAYLELLVHARAEVAEARQGRCRSGYLAGHLEEIGLEPPEGAVPDQIVAEGLALVARIGGDR